MRGHDIAVWSDFGVGVAGAAAALTGLLFVAVSINLERILAYSALPSRAGQTLTLFATPLLVSVAMLVPEQGGAALGLELIAIGIAAGVLLLTLSRARSAEEHPGTYLLVRVAPSLITSLGIVMAGASLLLGGPGGLLWIAPAVAAALLGGLANAWVLLVEIQR